MAWRWLSPTTSGRAPTARNMHASAIFSGELFVVGGWNGQTAFHDAFALDLLTFRWRELALRGDGTLENRALFGHAASERRLFVHGGLSPTNLNDIRSDLVALDPTTGQLRQVSTTGDGPGTIARHAIAEKDDALWVFGGWDGKRWLDTTYVLRLGADALSGRWERVETGGFTPYGRTHSCLLAMPAPSAHLMLYGGGDANTDFKSVYALDVRASYWERMTNVTGTEVALSQHACTLLPRPGGSVSIAAHGGFGGTEGRTDQSGDRQSDLRLLPLERKAWEWVAPRALHAPNSSRMGHSMDAVNSSCLVVFGGSLGGGKHAADALLAVPNSLHSRHAREDAEGPVDKVAGDEPRGSGAMLADEDLARSGSDAGEAPEEVVLRTMRTSDKKKPKARRGKKKKRKDALLEGAGEKREL